MQIYVKKSKLGREKTQNVQFEDKRSTRKYNGVHSQGGKTVKEEPEAKWEWQPQGKTLLITLPICEK